MSRTLFIMSQGAEDGLTWNRLVSALPTDPASIFTLILLLVSIGLVVWFGGPRKGKKSD